MKNTMRILSGLLTCLMVLSMLPVFATTTETTSASTPEAFYADFESFTVEPDVTKSTDSEWIAAGFNKGMSQNYNSISGNKTSGFAAKVVEDDVLGKAWKTPAKSDALYLGVGFDEPVTSGAVKLAFTVKGAVGDGFPFILYAQKMGTSYGQKIDGVQVRKSAYMGQLERMTSGGTGGRIYLSKDGGYAKSDDSQYSYFNIGGYHDVELIVDVDTDKRYLYVDGQKVGEHTNGSDYSIDSMQGYYFLHTSTSWETPMIDNILLTTYDVNSTTMNLVKTVNGDGKVKLVFDEVIDDSELIASDITFKEAGGTNNVTPSAIKVIGNTLEITFDASTATAGREYILSSDKLKSVNGEKKSTSIALVLKNAAEVKESITALKDYDDLNISDYVTVDVDDEGNGTHKMSKTDKYTETFAKETIFPMAHGEGYNGSNWSNQSAIYPVDWDKYRPDDGHGNVLSLGSYTGYYLANNQDTENEYGVEVYEFDFATKNKSNNYFQLQNNNSADSSATSRTKINKTFSQTGTWHHVKLEYDTVNDTATLYLDGDTGTVLTGVTKYLGLRIHTNWCMFDPVDDGACLDGADPGAATTSPNWFVLDNFESYILYTPLALEGARFVDKAGKDTISDSNVWAETTQIKVNFSEAVTEEAIENITVTKADSEDDIVTDAALSADGKTAILTVAGIVGSATYTINVPAGVTTTATTYTFTTEPGKFEINDFALTNADGTPIAAGTTDAENGNSLKVTADITNSNGTNKDVTIIYALYSGTTLVDVNFKDIKITPTSGDIDEDFTTKKDVTFDSWKAFIWDGFDTAVPQIEAFSGGAIN